MRRGSDVPAVMARVEATLEEAAASPQGLRGVIHLKPEGDRDVNVGRLRHLADIDVDLPSGSDRPLVGGAIRLSKRAVRRALRWYVSPIMEQQSRFNHAGLDLIERLRLRLRAAEQQGGGAALGQPDVGRHPDPDARARTYVSLFAGRSRVVHLECEDAQLLGALGGNGIVAYGVGLDDTVVEATRAAGSEMVLDDPAEHLRRIPPGSVDGLFTSLLATPRSPRELVALLRGAAQALAPGGVLVVETADAADLSGERHPVAMRPMHPRAVQAALSATGFSDVHTELAVAPEPPMPAATSDASLAEEIQRIDDVLTRRHVAAVVATGAR
jgi:hypothetical protein